MTWSRPGSIQRPHRSLHEAHVLVRKDQRREDRLHIQGNEL